MFGAAARVGAVGVILLGGCLELIHPGALCYLREIGLAR